MPEWKVTSSTRRQALVGSVTGFGGLMAATCRTGSGDGSSTAAKPVAAPVTIDVNAIPTTQPSDVAYRNLADLLKREVPNLTANINPSASLDKLQTMMAAGTPPDISGAIILELGTIYARNLAVPAHEVLKGTKTWQPDGFLPGLKASHSFKGELVTIPMVTSAAPLAINLDLYERAGLKAPTADWTWDNLAENAVKLTIHNGTETTQWGYAPFGAGDTLATNEFNTILHSFGGDWLDATGTVAAFNSPQGMAALEWFIDVFHRKQVAPFPFSAAWGAASGSPFTGRDRGFQLANSGGTAMTTYELESLVKYQQNLPFRWTTVLQPKKKKNAHHQSGFSWFIPRGAPHPDAATAFLRVAALPETLARFSLDESRLATHEAAFARSEWQAQLKQQPVLQTFWEAAKGGSTYPGIAGWTDARAVLAQAIGRAVGGEVAAQPALDEAARQANAIFAQARGS